MTSVPQFSLPVVTLPPPWQEPPLCSFSETLHCGCGDWGILWVKQVTAVAVHSVALTEAHSSSRGWRGRPVPSGHVTYPGR